MKISVTLQDISAGRRRDSKNCPVALALRRAGVNHCGVAGILVVVESGDDRISVVLPGRVQEWIRDYDWGFAMLPFEFDLSLPEAVSHQKPATSAPRDLLPAMTLPRPRGWTGCVGASPAKERSRQVRFNDKNSEQLELIGTTDDAA